MSRKETSTKICVRVLTPVVIGLRRDLVAMHVNRDRYLSELFKEEIERLATEVGFRTPDSAKKTIKKILQNSDLTKMTFVIDRDVEKRIKSVLAEKNILRNSFVNRVLYMLLAKPRHLKILNVAFSQKHHSAVKPLADAWSALNDPFFNIRSSNDGEFYKIVFPDMPTKKGGLNPFGLNCAISAEVWAEMSKPVDYSLLSSLGIG